jgi:predicted acylesterase/phospholipase RssA
MIEHIAISGAGPAGIIEAGMIHQALTEGVFVMDNIQSFHGTSAGAILSLLLCIGVGTQELVDYLIWRPWEKWLKYDISHFYENKGFVSSDCFEDLLSPFFHAYNVPMHITLAELYLRTGVDLYVYTTKVSTLESVVLHHRTHPDLPAIQAIMMSANMPILFTPIKYQDSYYVDGGIRVHCPTIPVPEENVLTFYINYNPSMLNMEDTKEYFNYLVLMMYYVVSNNTCPPQGNLIQYNEYSISDLDSWNKCIHEVDYRKHMIELGKQATMRYLENKTSRIHYGNEENTNS